MSKISKNIKMLDVLSSGNIYSCKKLSEILEVSPRTVRQYKEELEKEGIYIETIMGPFGGYRLCSKIEVPSILFHKEDIDKIDSVLNILPINEKEKLEDIREKINFYCRFVNGEGNFDSKTNEKLTKIEEAIHKKEKITIEYYGKGEKKTRDIIPIQVYIYEKLIMVIVQYSSNLTDIRHLNLKRIEKIL